MLKVRAENYCLVICSSWIETLQVEIVAQDTLRYLQMKEVV